MRTTVTILIAAAVVLGVRLSAHHSFAAEYIENRTVTVEGDLVEFDYRSPHTWIRVMTRTPNGEQRKVSGEWAGAARLGRMGIGANAFKPGDHLILTGAPGRNPTEHRLHVKTIERPSDGWTWRGADRETGADSQRFQICVARNFRAVSTSL